MLPPGPHPHPSQRVTLGRPPAPGGPWPSCPLCSSRSALKVPRPSRTRSLPPSPPHPDPAPRSMEVTPLCTPHSTLPVPFAGSSPPQELPTGRPQSCHRRTRRTHRLQRPGLAPCPVLPLTGPPSRSVLPAPCPPLPAPCSLRPGPGTQTRCQPSREEKLTLSQPVRAEGGWASTCLWNECHVSCDRGHFLSRKSVPYLTGEIKITV